MTERLEQLHAAVEAARTEVRKVILGQEDAIDAALMVILTRQHALIEGVPGVAKTLLARTLAHVLGCEFARIQFTPDLMPADITGHQRFQFPAESNSRWCAGRCSRRFCWPTKSIARRPRRNRRCCRRCRSGP